MAEKKVSIITQRSDFGRSVIKILSAGRYRPGIANAEEMDAVTKYVILTVFILFGLAIFIPFTVGLALTPGTDVSIIVIDSLFCIFMAILLILTRTKVPFAVPAVLLVSAYTFFVCYMIIDHPNGGQSAALWSIILPPLAYYVLGNYGMIPSAIVSVVMIYSFNKEPDWYTYDFALRCAIMYVFTLAFASLAYKRTEVLTLALGRSRTLLQDELNEVEAMKDNLDVGIFLLNSDFIIQPYYSKYLPQIFNIENLEEVEFLSVLKASLKEKELELLKDFLEMILVSSFDAETLQDVNPLQKFKFTASDGVEKTLAITFTQITRLKNEKVLLVVARDITRESDLEEKLAQEELFRQNEMKAMFEVMHVSPHNLSEFLDELDFEFQRMNDALKDKNRHQKDVYHILFQGMHAMKSNALIIGLDSVAERFHEFEDKVSALLRNNNMAYESLLEIVFELERVMEIADNLKNIVKKMEAFSESSKNVSTSSQIVVQAIRNAVNKIKADIEKDAVVSVKKLDWEGVNPEYRRVIKELLLQLTRNALVHGIEPILEREGKGKKAEGLITLSIEKASDDSKILIEFIDDGAGIDFDKVKKQAIEKKLITTEAQANDKSTLIKAIFSPGFSTAEGLSMHAGRGIGLSLVSERIREYKGSIKVQSAPNQGTKFIIELPYKKVS